MFYSLSASRMRIVALLIVAALSFAAVTTVAVHFAAPADAAKKKKKCKKGYKKNKNGKCKKKKSTKTSAVVSAVSVEITDASIYKLYFKGTVTTKTPQTSIPVKVIAKYGRDVDTTVTATGDGVSNTLTFTGDVRNPRTAPGAPRRGPTLTIEAIADGISSGPQTSK